MNKKIALVNPECNDCNGTGIRGFLANMSVARMDHTMRAIRCGCVEFVDLSSIETERPAAVGL